MPIIPPIHYYVKLLEIVLQMNNFQIMKAVIVIVLQSLRLNLNVTKMMIQINYSIFQVTKLPFICTL